MQTVSTPGSTDVSPNVMVRDQRRQYGYTLPACVPCSFHSYSDTAGDFGQCSSEYWQAVCESSQTAFHSHVHVRSPVHLYPGYRKNVNSMVQPPQDIVDAIVEQVDDQQALLACSQLSHSWRASSLPLLFQSVTSTSPRLTDRREHDLKALAAFLSSETAVKAYIKELTVTTQSVELQLLCQILSELPRLKSLRLIGSMIIGRPPTNPKTFLLESVQLSEVGYGVGRCHLRELLDLFPALTKLSLRRPESTFLAPTTANTSASLHLSELSVCCDNYDFLDAQTMFWVTDNVVGTQKLVVDVTWEAYESLSLVIHNLASSLVHLRIRDIHGYCDIG